MELLTETVRQRTGLAASLVAIRWPTDSQMRGNSSADKEAISPALVAEEPDLAIAAE